MAIDCMIIFAPVLVEIQLWKSLEAVPASLLATSFIEPPSPHNPILNISKTFQAEHSPTALPKNPCTKARNLNPFVATLRQSNLIELQPS